MSLAVETEKTIWTAADLLERFGPILLNRVRTDPPPGQGTEQDVIDFDVHEDRLYELIDGVLLEKAMGAYESYLGVLLASFLNNFVREHDLGVVLGSDGMLRLFPGRVRLPDVCFISTVQSPIEEMQQHPIAELIPDLAVEVISKSNTEQEMTEKLRDYFQSGTRLVWYVYPSREEVDVYRNVDNKTTVTRDETLDGGDVLPGFKLALIELFADDSKAKPSKEPGK